MVLVQTLPSPLALPDPRSRLLGTQVFHCLQVRMQNIAIDPPIPDLLLRADLALPGQPADVFGMVS